MNRKILRPCFLALAFGPLAIAQSQSEGAFELQVKSDRVLWQGGAEKLNLNEIGLLNQGLKGNIEGLDATVSWSSSEFKSQGLTFTDLRIALSGKKWTLADGALLKLSCTDLRASLNLSKLNLPWAKVEAELAAGNEQLKLTRISLGSEALESWFVSLLNPKNLSFQAQCPGNAKNILEGLLRARLQSFVSEGSSALRKSMANDLKSHVETRLLGQSIPFNEIFKGNALLSELLKNASGRFLLTFNHDVWTISGSPRVELGEAVLGVAEPLKTSEWRVYLGTKNLNQSLSAVVQRLDYEAAASKDAFTLDKSFRVKDFVAILPELSSVSSESTFKFRIKPAFCASNIDRGQSIRPFVSKTGFRRGFEVHVGLNLELVSETGTVLSERHLPDLGLELFVKNERAWSLGALWVVDYNDEQMPCSNHSILALPFELALSVEMALESPETREPLKKLVTSMTVSQAKWGQAPLFWGQTSLSPRERGGFFASGIILSGTGF
jgi:hypothetical protein